jgi:XTP/dITP diphosphohydrolase
MKKILIATNNNGKFLEIAKLLESLEIQAVPASSLNLIEPEENAETFTENAFIKAKFYGDNAKILTLADDSGLCIEALENNPGVRSARYAIDNNGNKNFEFAFEKIFTELQKKNIFSEQKPSAFFVCNLCLYNPKNNFKINFEGRVDGYLTYPALGNKGFGYDSIFIKNGMNQTFGEIDSIFKHQISHRAEAFLQLENWLKKNYNIFD